ncbi:MAG: 23S rRNA (guanosine(2251)-2'-O)-methyltransferase RlmB [Anaerolineales bacterium]
MRETLYGRQAIRESLRAGRRQPYRLLLSARVEQSAIMDEIVALAKEYRVPIKTMDRYEMDHIVGHDRHQGVALETSDYPYARVDEMLDLAQRREEPPLLLMLDLIQDVYNVGSLVRAAEASGVHGMIIQRRRAAEITAAVVNTSSGAVEHLLVAQVTNLAQEIARIKEPGVWVAGLEAAPSAKLYTEADLTMPLALVVGSEGEGLRRLVRERCDWLMALPMKGEIASLNAAIAGSIALYEVLRQRGAAS